MGILATDSEYDLFCNQRLHDPYPLFARLRQEDPVHWCEPMNMWLLTRYDDISRLIRDNKRLISDRESMYTDTLRPENLESASPLVRHIGLWLQNNNPPNHTRLRKLVNVAFTPRMIEDLEPRIGEIVNDLLDKASKSGETDFIQSFCLPLPAIVICEMLGIPPEHRERYRDAVEGLIPFASCGGPGLNDAVGPARDCLDELIAFFDELIMERRANPTEDLISALAGVEEDGDRLTKEELFALCVFLFLAGHETTMGLLAGGTLGLLQNRDQFDLLKSDPGTHIDKAVEEIVRYECPVTRAVRVPTEDIEVRGKTIKKGDTITMLLGAANRDPAVFSEPDRLDITRHPNKHLGFGLGIHFCLGAPLARREGRIAFPEIVKRFPTMKLATEAVDYKRALGIRSILSLPVTF